VGIFWFGKNPHKINSYDFLYFVISVVYEVVTREYWLSRDDVVNEEFEGLWSD
jgi:hypothetical protein